MYRDFPPVGNSSTSDKIIDHYLKNNTFLIEYCLLTTCDRPAVDPREIHEKQQSDSTADGRLAVNLENDTKTRRKRDGKKTRRLADSFETDNIL